jgi:hypothetical protein
MLKWLLNVLWPKKPEIWQWCFRCKKATPNIYRKMIWWDEKVDMAFCACGARKAFSNKK